MFLAKTSRHNRRSGRTEGARSERIQPHGRSLCLPLGRIRDSSRTMEVQTRGSRGARFLAVLVSSSPIAHKSASPFRTESRRDDDIGDSQGYVAVLTHSTEIDT